MHRFAVYASLAAALVSLSPAANAQSGRPSGQARVYYAVEPSLVADVMREDGFSVEIETKEEDGARTASLRGERDGFKANADVRVCDEEGYPKGCLGVRFFATYTIEPDEREAAIEAARTYTNEYFLGKAYLADDTTLVVESYFIIDGGVTRAHIVENWTEFQAVCDRVVSLWLEALDAPTPA